MLTPLIIVSEEVNTNNKLQTSSYPFSLSDIQVHWQGNLTMSLTELFEKLGIPNLISSINTNDVQTDIKLEQPVEGTTTTTYTYLDGSIMLKQLTIIIGFCIVIFGSIIEGVTIHYNKKATDKP